LILEKYKINRPKDDDDGQPEEDVTRSLNSGGKKWLLEQQIKIDKGLCLLTSNKFVNDPETRIH
jgi:hypothetical protein